MRKIALLAALLIVCSLAGPGWAADKDKDTATQYLDPITVLADSEPEPANSPYRIPTSSRAATWLITQQEIRPLQPRDIFDVLSYAPGVQLAFQGRKGMNFLSSRGGGNFIGGTNFAILLDGVYVPWTQSSRVLASFPVDAIESIRVVRDSSILTMGPLAGLGSIGAAVQGFIIIKTKIPTEQETELKLRYGNLNRAKIFASHGDKLENVYYSLAYNKYHDDGRTDWNNGSDSDSLLLKAGYDARGLTANFSFYHDWASRETMRAMDISKVCDSKWEYDPLNTMMASLNLAKAWNRTQTTSLGVYFGSIEADLQKWSYSNPNRYSVEEQEETSLQAALRHIITTESNTFHVGTQAIFWETPTGEFFYTGIARREQLYSLYAYDEYFLSKAWSIDGAARVDHKHVSKGVNKYAPTDTTPTELIEDEWAEPSYSVALGTSYRLSDIWRLSFKTSYVMQAADDYLETEDGQSLETEKQWRNEAGVIAHFNQYLRVALSLFRYDLTDTKKVVGSITVDDEVYNVYANADVARQGFEVDMRGALPMVPLTYQVSYSYQYSDNDTDNDSIPHHLISLRLGYTYQPFSANLMVRYVSPYDSNQFSVGNIYYEIGNYTRLDANINYDFEIEKVQMRATLFGQNLTDERYQTRLGWEDVGLTFGLELGFKF
jgi:iron complex outermembrane receptor protein